MTTLFISYSHQDETWKDRLMTHLRALDPAYQFEVWVDRQIQVGDDWEAEIEGAMARADIAVMLISADFLASEFIRGIEVPRLLQRRADEGMRLVPVLVGSCLWKETPWLAELQCLPRDGREMASFRGNNVDKQWTKVAKAIAGFITKPTEADGAAVSTPSGVKTRFEHPYPMQPNFTGRVAERQALTQWFLGSGQPLCGVIAIGGMGKSALTWAWTQRDLLGRELPGQTEEPDTVAHTCRVPADKRPEAVFWWSFYENDARFPQCLTRFLEFVEGQPVPKDLSGHDAVMRAVAAMRQRRILLVLDGLERELRAYARLDAAYLGDDAAVDDRDGRCCIDPTLAEFLRCLASFSLTGRVLFSSRLLPRELEGHDRRPLANCFPYTLVELSSEDMVAFFQANGIAGVRGEIQVACGRFGGHPLALRLLAGMIRHDPEHPGDVRAAENYDPVPDLVQREHHVLALAYQALDEQAKRLLGRLAAFRAPVAYAAVKALAPNGGGASLRKTLNGLRERGFLFFDSEAKRYDLHPIVRQYAYDHLVDKTAVHRRLKDYFTAAPASNEDWVETLGDLEPVIELYHHTLRAGLFDEARELFRDRLVSPLYYRFGAYQTVIELLGALFPDGEKAPPRLKQASDQAWTMNALANAYGLAGLPRRAVPLYEMQTQIRDKADDKRNLAIGLGNLAYNLVMVGELAAAEENLRRRIALCREIGDDFKEAIGHRELGRLLAYHAVFDKAEAAFKTAEKLNEKYGATQSLTVIWSHRALAALLQGQAQAALAAAQEALDFWRQTAVRRHPYVRDRVRVDWLLGAAKTALAAEDGGAKTLLAGEAEGHLSEALQRCRRINLVDHEPDILLAWARLHRLGGRDAPARIAAEDGLRIAERCEFRLQQAELNLFLAQLAHDDGDQAQAHILAQKARDLAFCDGPPHCCQVVLDQANALLTGRALRQAQGGPPSTSLP